ncbi:uncharacterized protein LOC144356500 [Saccoglossus kowalevskii]
MNCNVHGSGNNRWKNSICRSSQAFQQLLEQGAVNTGGARKESLQETYMLLYYDVQLCEDGSILCNGECVHANNVCKARCNCIPPQLRSRLRTRSTRDMSVKS